MATDRDDRPLSVLFSELTRDTTTLVRQEIELAKAEVSEKVSQAMSGITGIVAGGAILFAGLLVLEYLAIVLLDLWLEHWLAALIVAVLTLIIGYVALRSGISKLKATNLAPRKTAESLRRDAEFAKEQVR